MNHSLAAAAAKVGGGTLLSRLLGFLRDLLIARLFGADQATDAFVVAFRLPNLLRRLFAEGAFATALIPVLAQQQASNAQSDRDTTRALVSELTGSLGVLLLLLSGLGLLVAPWLMLALAPGFDLSAPQGSLTVDLIRLTVPYVFFVGLTALAGALLNSFGRFALPALMPAVLNLALIGCALLLAPRLQQPILALGFGVLLGGLAQLALQLPALARLGLLSWPRVNWKNPVLRRFLTTLGPTLIGLSITQINLLLDTLLASFLVAGSISWLYYAERLMDFPLGILGVALATAMVPRLARAHIQGTRDDFAATLDWALRWMALLGLPAAAGLFILAEPVITTLFLSAQFDATDAHLAASALMAYTLGLPGFMALKILLPGFYSRGDTQVPLRLGLVMVGANLLLSLALMGPLGHTGLALATALAATLGMALVLRKLLVETHGQLGFGWPKLLFRIALSVLTMGVVLEWVQSRLPPWSAQAGGERLMGLAGLILLGILIYPLTLALLGLRPDDLHRQARP